MDPFWDAENRLIQVTPRSPSGKETRNRDVHFEYDYMNRRIRKFTYAWSGTAWGTSIAEDTRFVYDGWNVVQEIDGLSPGTTGTTDVIRNYTWGLDLSGQNGNPSVGGIHGAGGIGGLLATHWTKGTTSTSDDSKYVYFYDANGNVGQMMDVVSTSSGYGTIAAQYEYYPFGGLLDAQGVAAEGNPFRFSTKYRDNEDGSYYYGYRYLRTKHGRWLSRDPMEEAGGINIYTFVTNDTTQGTDALGKQCCCCPTAMSITNINKKDDGVWILLPPTQFGVEFDVEISLEYKCVNNGTAGGDCNLTWSERLNRVPTFYKTGKPGEWIDVDQAVPNNTTTTRAWGGRNKKCPSTETVRLHDYPNESTKGGVYTIDFLITVTGGTGCGCPSMSVTASLFLDATKGVIRTQQFHEGFDPGATRL